ncbi:MAG: hypothetical protein IPK54_10270 [Dokdonella sp.]|uniref:LamG-like jellyroll fold domain-containing protein n=1 Tax=Dokdonella sp. TaxID=2291710 RepID=UPI0025C5E77C|nr:LamG-like jellyroll fold domain-containing protein [Dokdonella sp.]MBK8123917.1 hypothetical protein [Dokdonella sp.]
MSEKDPLYDSVTLLLPMCFGGGGSQAFGDFSSSPKNISVVGSVAISSNQSRYYGRSVNFPGPTGYLRTTDSIDLFAGLGDFAIECYAWKSSAPSGSVDMLFHILATYGFNFEWRTDNKLGLFLHGGTTTYDVSVNTLALSAWNHIVLKRVAGVFKVILNGVLQFSRTVSKPMPTSVFYIGHDATASDRDFGPGYMCGVRITRDDGRYPDSFSDMPGPLVVPHFPDYSPPLIAVGNNVTVSGNGAGDYVVIIDATTKELVKLVALGGVANWSDDIPEGEYYLTYFADGCQPITHGPYTITAT